jgi:predicted helicase
LSNNFKMELCNALEIQNTNSIGLPEGISPESVFHYIYSLLHSSGYRYCFAEILKTNFPPVPFVSNLKIFKLLEKIGSELANLHLMGSLKTADTHENFVTNSINKIEKIVFNDGMIWIDRKKTAGFTNVPTKVWNFSIGGYQVCQKWLKDRKGRVLTSEEIKHYQKIIFALSETIRLQVKIDKVIDEHGGWPGAFVTDKGGPA